MTQELDPTVDDIEQSAVDAARQMHHTSVCPYCGGTDIEKEGYAAITEGALIDQICTECGLNVTVTGQVWKRRVRPTDDPGA